jgi:uncharacterized protein (DUF58 family)
MFTALRDRITARVAAWARRRQGLDELPLELRARRLYILPTGPGLSFGLLLFIMLVAGLNYTNSLALLLTFVLAAFVLVGMHECQRTLNGLELVLAQAADCHAGTEGLIELRFVNRSAQARRALQVRARGARASPFDLDAGAQVTVQLPFQALRRGRQRIERLELASTAPFGLFRCWTWLHLPLEAIVYPQPLGTRPLPRGGESRSSREFRASSPADEEWTSLRHYQPGDSPRSIAWKAWARGAPLMVAQYQGAGGSEHLLSFAGLESLDLEARLSQICAWVQDCVRLDAACALQLPGVDLPLGRGAAHRRSLLRALALYGSDAVRENRTGASA